MKLHNAKFAFMSTLLGLKNSEPIIEKLKKIASPTMIVWGADDPVIPIKFANDFVTHIENCKFFEMNDCGHTPYVQEPKRFALKVSEFLKIQ